MSSRVLFTPVKREFLVVQRASNSAGNSLRITGDLRLSQSSNIKPCSPQDGGRRARGCVPGRHVVGPAAARGVASPLPRGTAASCHFHAPCCNAGTRMTPMKIPSRGGVARSATVVVERRGGSVAATLLDPVPQKGAAFPCQGGRLGARTSHPNPAAELHFHVPLVRRGAWVAPLVKRLLGRWRPQVHQTSLSRDH